MSTKIKIFLSHNSADKPAVETLAFRLRAIAENDIDPWLDKWNLVPGAPWQKELEDTISTCAVAAVFVGPHGFGSWHHEEMRTLISRRVEDRTGSFRVIPVLLPGAERGARSSLPKFLVNTTWVEFHHTLDDDEAFRRLVLSIRGKSEDPPPPPGATAACPYRGLKYFDIGDAHLFFGREAVTGWLVDYVRKPLRAGLDAPRFVAILGASGSGKSSLARAGLYAALKQGAIEGSENWLFVPPLRPGSNPLESLEIEFLKAAAGSPHLASVATHLKELATNPAALHRAARQLVSDSSPPRRVFLFVDQFEEIFTECDKAGLRGQFLAALLYAARERGGPVIVVLAMRADFYPKVAAFEELARVMDQHQFLVGPMSEDELRQAIELPAYRAGADFDPGLVDKLIEDVRGQPGALPLLQHALAALWRERINGRQLTHDAYRTMGGLSGALEKHANRIFDNLTPDQQKLCEHLFLRLVHPGEGAEDTKRRVPLAELTSSGNPAVIAKLIATLSHENKRLIVTEGGDGQKGDAPATPDAKNNLHSASPAFVEVAHEALIRSWSRLRKWIDADRSGLRTHRRLTEAAKEWEDKRRHPEFLYSRGRLAIAREWAANHRDQITRLEDEFLDASLREEERAARARRSTKTLLKALVAVLLAIPLGGIATWFFIQYHTYYAELGGKDRPDELVITRQLKHGAPLTVSTGFTRDLLLAGAVTNFGFAVPHAVSDWSTLENHLHPLAKARLQLATRLDAIAAAGDDELAELASTVSQEALEHPDITLVAAADPKTFEYVFAMLRTGNPAAKRSAATALGRLGEKVPGERVGVATDALLGALEDNESFVKRAAALALGRIGEKLPGDRVGAVTDALLAVLKDNASSVKMVAAEALGRLGAKLPGKRVGAVTDALLAALKDNDSGVKRAAAEALGRLQENLPGERVGEFTDALLAALKDNASSVRIVAAEVLGRLGEKLPGEPVGAITEALLVAVRDNDRDVKNAAASALGRVAEKLPSERVGAVTEALLVALKDYDRYVKNAAASALERVAEKLPEEHVGAVTGALLVALKNNDLDVKNAAASALGRIAEKLPGEHVGAVTEALLGAVKDNGRYVRIVAVKALGRVGQKLPEEHVAAVTEALLMALKDNDWDVKKAAVSALGLLGEKLLGERVAAFTEALLVALKDSDSEVITSAASALGLLGEKLPEEHVGAVTEALLMAVKNNDRYVRIAAVTALGQLGEKLPEGRAGAVSEALLIALKDNDSYVRHAAASALGGLGKKLAGERVWAVTAALVAALKDDDLDVKQMAASALGRVAEKLPGERVGAFTEALLVALKDINRFAKSAAASALGLLGEKLPGERVGAVTEALLGAVKDSDSDVISAATSALGLLGEKLPGERVGAFTEALLVAVKDINWFAKRASASALGLLGEKLPAQWVGTVMDALLAALKDNDADVKRAAAKALGSVAQRIDVDEVKRAECVRALIGAARQPMKKDGFASSSGGISQACYASLQKLTADQSKIETRVLLKNLEHLDSRERLLAIFTLPRRKLGDSELKEIRSLRNDPQNRPWARMAALETLVEIAREAEAVARDKEVAAKAAEEEKKKKAGVKAAPPR